MNGVGVVVPPANPVVEEEVREFTGPGLRWHTTRLPVVADTSLDRRNAEYLRAIPAAANSFGTLPLAGVYIACTGCHYDLDPDRDRQLYDGLSVERPVRSSTLIVAEVLAAVGAKRIHLVSPYEEWLTERAVGYWERSGYAVDSVVHARSAEQHSVYELTADALDDSVRRARLPVDGVVVFSGTGIETGPAMSTLAAGSTRVLLSANLCGAWWAARLLARPLARPHPLLVRLRQQTAR